MLRSLHGGGSTQRPRPGTAAGQTRLEEHQSGELARLDPDHVGGEVELCQLLQVAVGRPED